MGMATNLVMTSTLAALIILFDRPLLVLFLGSHSPAVAIASHIQLICTWSFIIQGVMMILSGTMRAYGAVVLPTIILFLAFYPARLGFYAIAFPLIGGEAVWWSYPVGSIAAAVLTAAAYRFGGWRKQRHLVLPGGGVVPKVEEQA